MFEWMWFQLFNDQPYNIFIFSAIAVFAGCGVTEECDDNLLLTFEEGQKIIVNISLDYIGGGPRGQHQEINFIFLKNSTTNLFSCNNPQDCCNNRPQCRNVPNPDIPIILEIIAQQDAHISDSGVYTAEVEVQKGSQIESITSKLTINVTKSTGTCTCIYHLHYHSNMYMYMYLPFTLP